MADQATGFSFRKSPKQWQQTNFKADLKFIVHETPGKDTPWAVRQIGKDDDFYTCEKPINDIGNLFCSSGATAGTFIMNATNRRYVRTSSFGYWVVLPSDNPPMVDSDAKSDDLVIEIGKCSPM